MEIGNVPIVLLSDLKTEKRGTVKEMPKYIFDRWWCVENVPLKTGKQPAFNYHIPKRGMNVSLVQNRLTGLC